MSAETGKMTGADVEFQRYHVTLADGGGHYAETDLSNFVVEPWNAISSLVLLLPAIYWAYKIRGKVKEQGFLALCIPLLILGGLGSTMFHAFRSSPLLLMMDVLPMLVLTTAVGAFFWKHLLNNWIIALAIVFSSFAIRMLVSNTGIFPHHTAANVSYAVSGLTIFLPAILIGFKTRFYKMQSLATSIVLFVLALFFRETDAWHIPSLEMGTHFLWHISTAVGAYFLAKYLYHLTILKQQTAAEKVRVRA